MLPIQHKKKITTVMFLSKFISKHSFSNVATIKGMAFQNEDQLTRLETFKMDRHLYLVKPEFLELKYVINPFMKLSRDFSLARALQQHEFLVNTYKNIFGGLQHISLIKPAKGLTELTFFGDSIFAIGNKALYSRLSCPEREQETDYVAQSMRKLGLEGPRVPENIFFEGSGETLMWNDKILIGYGQRNSKNVVEYVRNHFDKEVIGLELVDPSFYHLDTALFCISNNLIAVYEEAFSKKSLKILKSLDCEILSISKEECMKFALNSVVFGNDVVVHEEATGFISQLRSRGYQVHTVDVSEFMKFGGGLKCLTYQHYI